MAYITFAKIIKNIKIVEYVNKFIGGRRRLRFLDRFELHLRKLLEKSKTVSNRIPIRYNSIPKHKLYQDHSITSSTRKNVRWRNKIKTHHRKQIYVLRFTQNLQRVK